MYISSEPSVRPAHSSLTRATPWLVSLCRTNRLKHSFVCHSRDLVLFFFCSFLCYMLFLSCGCWLFFVAAGCRAICPFGDNKHSSDLELKPHYCHWLFTSKHLALVWWSLILLLWGGVLKSFLFSSGKLWNISSAVFAVITNLKSAAATQLFFEKIKSKTTQSRRGVVNCGFYFSPFNQMMQSGSWSWQKWLEACESQMLSLSLRENILFWTCSVKCWMPPACSVLSLFFSFFSKFSVIQQWSLNNRVGLFVLL